jgi:tartrate-resistant acid phosphatase type 5
MIIIPMNRFIITADTGSGTIHQKNVAHSMFLLQKKMRNINSVLLLGDNIYPGGCHTIHDQQFNTKFEDIYHKINLPFYLCLGNHDYGLSYHPSSKGVLRNNSMVQVEYAKISEKWNMPAKYYHYTRGPCDFFMIDTNFDALNESSIQKQLHEVQKMIQQSKKTWKILCGHHTFRSVGGHGNADPRFEKFMKDLITDCHIDIYMCGHDHCKCIIETRVNDKPLTCLVIGTGGKEYEKIFSLKKIEQAPTPSELLFYSPNLGTCLVEADQKHLKLICFNEDLVQEYSYSKSK